MKKTILSFAFILATFAAFAQNTAGIGAQIEVRYDSMSNHFFPYVKTLKSGYPAEKVLKVGDMILKIDNFETKDQQNEGEIRQKYLMGPDSTSVDLLIKGIEDKKTKKVTIARKAFLDSEVAGTCVKGDCKNGIGIWKSPTGDTYEGAFKRSVLDGIGKITSGTGDKFEGLFVNGKKQGIGKITKKNTETWDGNFENDLANGFFKIKFASTDTYEGNVTGGAITGKGKKTFKTGEIWDGEWLNGMLNGYAKCNYKTGDTYEGYFTSGKKNGWGKFVKPKGFAYDGMFKADRRVGYGQYIYTELTVNRRLEGDFVSERCKKGTVYYEPEESKVWKYEGDLDFESRPMNVGKIYYRDGKWEEGKFENGKIAKQTGKGVMTLNDTKGVKLSDKEVPAAVERVITDIEGKLKSEGYELETKTSSKANAFATLSGTQGYTYVVAALGSLATLIYYIMLYMGRR